METKELYERRELVLLEELKQARALLDSLISLQPGVGETIDAGTADGWHREHLKDAHIANIAAISRAVMEAGDFILTRNAEAAEVKKTDVVGLFNARNAKDFGA
jgi:orotidine-5'-phosphate decarboxylase